MNSPEMELFLLDFYSRMKRYARNIFVVCVFCIVAGSGVGLFLMIQEDDLEMLIGGLIFAAPFVIPAISSFLSLVRDRTIQDWKPYRMAVTHRQDVVWAYFITTQIVISGAPVGKKRGIGFADRHGKRCSLGLSKSRMEALQSVLPIWFPEATIGYSEELEARFAKDPASLYIGS
ncbi:MAG: hypothetical protein QF752_10245 [Planctomycetota bacterium]|nr:hypothetical protein [Planctomycetota bacterium]